MTGMRPYQLEEDYWRLRAFLREVFLLNNRQELSWQVARLDYWRFFGNECLEHYKLSDAISLWEQDGQVIAFITPESRGYAYLQVHPDKRCLDLEMDMIVAAEQQLVEVDEKGQRHLTVWAHQTDQLRIQALQQRGYTRGDWPEHQFRCYLDEKVIPDTSLPAGYIMRSLGDESELPARSWLSWRVFHPDEPDENYRGWEWYQSIQRCPLYRRDLDLVTVAPDGSLAAFTTVWYDDVTRCGYFEPVGTSPDHQRKGLGKSILYEGLRRLKHQGAIQANVAGYSEAAIKLYGSVMSPNAMIYERWHKKWPQGRE